MGKTKQAELKEVKAEMLTPMKMNIYKPIPRFKSGCKKC